MPLPKRVNLNDKIYKVREVSAKNYRGECDPPDKVGKEIRIQRGLGDEEFMEVSIHEMIHGSGWCIDEQFITRFSADAARFLKECGYRRND